MIYPDLLRFMADRVGARTVEVRSSNASAVSHPTRSPGWSWPPPGSVRGAGQAWLRSWRVAEDMDRSLAASIRLIVVAASRLRNRLDRKLQVGKAAQVEPGVAGGRAPVVEGVDGHALPDGVQHRLPGHAGIP